MTTVWLENPDYDRWDSPPQDWKHQRDRQTLDRLYQAIIVPVPERARPLVRSILWSPPRTEEQRQDFQQYLMASFPGDLWDALVYLREHRHQLPRAVWRDPDVLHAASMLTTEVRRRGRVNPENDDEDEEELLEELQAIAHGAWTCAETEDDLRAALQRIDEMLQTADWVMCRDCGGAHPEEGPCPMDPHP